MITRWLSHGRILSKMLIITTKKGKSFSFLFFLCQGLLLWYIRRSGENGGPGMLFPAFVMMNCSFECSACQKSTWFRIFDRDSTMSNPSLSNWLGPKVSMTLFWYDPFSDTSYPSISRLTLLSCPFIYCAWHRLAHFHYLNRSVSTEPTDEPLEKNIRHL